MGVNSIFSKSLSEQIVNELQNEYEEEYENEYEDNQINDDIETVSEEIKNSKNVWDPLSEEWQEKILSKNFFIKNDSFCISIEEALTNSGFKTSRATLMRNITKFINNMSIMDFSNFIKDYRAKYTNGVSIGIWDPFVISNKKDFIKTIKNSDFFFACDDTTLYLLSKSLQLDILVLHDDYSIYFTNNNFEKIVVLFFDSENNCFFSIGSKSKKKIHTLFLRSKLQKNKEILNLIDRNDLLIKHTQNAMKHLFHLNDILDYIESKIKSDLSLADKEIIFKLF